MLGFPSIILCKNGHHHSQGGSLEVALRSHSHLTSHPWEALGASVCVGCSQEAGARGQVSCEHESSCLRDGRPGEPLPSWVVVIAAVPSGYAVLCSAGRFA